MLIYIAGPYNGKDHDAISANIAHAREVAIAVWRAGHVALCPHLNTAHFEVDAGLPEEAYYKGDIELLAVCDGVVMTPDWERSTGARGERMWAEEHNMPVWVYPNIPGRYFIPDTNGQPV